MLSAWIPLVLAIAVLAAIPFGLKWLQRRIGVGAVGGAVSAKVISAVAVGPHQRVVTVEVGPQDARVWLTLGVTAQNITCLHTSAVASGPTEVARSQDTLTTGPRE
jgi:flagellar protein FliO/FliZ